MATERARKQMYLVENVQRKGYDTTQFANYMASQKKNGNDVDVWSLEEIKDVSLMNIVNSNCRMSLVGVQIHSQGRRRQRRHQRSSRWQGRKEESAFERFLEAWLESRHPWQTHQNNTRTGWDNGWTSRPRGKQVFWHPTRVRSQRLSQKSASKW